MMRKTSTLILIVLLSTSLILPGVMISSFNLDGKPTKKSNCKTFDLMGWGDINLDVNPDIYTAPFFDVIRLSNETEERYVGGAITSADFNSDGWTDFATSFLIIKTAEIWYHKIFIFYNTGNLSFEKKSITPCLYHTCIWDMKAGDFDGDGDKDILITREIPTDEDIPNYVAEILWNVNSTFDFFKRTTIFHIRKYGIPEYNITSGSNDWGVPHIAVADFNQDGYDDFVLGTNCANVTLFLNKGNGNFSYGGIIYDYGTLCKGLATADFNHDGYPDLVVCAENDGTGPINASGYIYLKLNNHSPECFDRTHPGILIATLPVEGEANFTIGAETTGTVEVLDYNNDGLLDVIFSGDFWVHMFIQEENYTFKPFVVALLRSRELTWSDNLLDGGFAVADFNRDGWDDFVQGGSGSDEGSVPIRLFINNRTFTCITKPVDRTAYVFGREAIGVLNLLIKFPGDKLVIGPVDVAVDCLCEMSRVEFYVDGKLVYTDDQPPFTWKWDKPGFGKYLLYVKAYDEKGEFAGRDNVVLWKIL